MPSASDPLLKLIRAHEHLDDLYADVQWWLQTDPYRVIRERDPETNARLIYVEPTSQPPDKLALIAGDVVHNLRSCLDMLALALAEVNYGGELPADAEKESQFPICSERDIFRETRRRRIPCIASRPQALIQRVQPYRAGKLWEHHPLWVLRELSDFDKHRRLPLIGAYAGVSSAGVTKAGSDLWEMSLDLGGVLDKKTEIARLKGLGPDEVDMDIRLATSVVFADEAPAMVVEEALYGVLDQIWRYVSQEVIGRLKPYLAPVETDPPTIWPPGFKPKKLTIRKPGQP